MVSQHGIVQLLKSNVCDIVFTKADGSRREMRATLMETYLPPVDAEKVSFDQVTKNPDVVKCWDLKSGGWRSFRIDRMQNIKVTVEEV